MIEPTANMLRLVCISLCVWVCLCGCKKESATEVVRVATKLADGGVALVPQQAAGPRGTLQVSVRLEGTPPEMKPLRRGSDPFCARTEMSQQIVLVGDGGGLLNVVVRIKPGTVSGVASKGPVVVEQVDCMYRPRVQVAVVGQVLEFRNPDDTFHNIHARHREASERQATETLFNRGQPAKGVTVKKRLAEPEIIELKCDSHAWMQGFVVVSDHPYAAVTEGKGLAVIGNVPVGSYTLEIWHEFYGVKTTKVTVVNGQTASLEVVFDAKKDQPAGL